MVIDTKALLDDAATMGLTSEISRGKIRLEGRLGNVKRAFAAQGCDLVRQGTTGYAVYLGDHHGSATYVAQIYSIEPSYSYACTCL